MNMQQLKVNTKLRLFYFSYRNKILKSNLFDQTFYLNNNPDVQKSGIDPLKHYLFRGGREGRNPGSQFNGNFYLLSYPDVYLAGLNPLLHYINRGKTEGRLPFSEELCDHLTGSNNLAMNGIDDFLLKTYGNISSLNTGDLILAARSGLFDQEYYLRSNEDVRLSGYAPLIHYFQMGWKEMRNPGKFFDTRYYYNSNEDVKASGLNPLVHYLRYGAAEGRPPRMFFINENDYALEADISEVTDDLTTAPGLKVAVVCHLFFHEMAEEFVSYFRRIPVPYTLFLTTTYENARLVDEFFTDQLPGVPVKIIPVENRGRDIAPFISLLKNELTGFDLICKVHSKKSDHTGQLHDWRRYLLDQLLGSSGIIKTIIHEFEKDDHLGFIWPVAHLFLKQSSLERGWGPAAWKATNLKVAKKYFPELNPEAAGDDFTFPTGSMFWCRTTALEKLAKPAVGITSFERESNQGDGTLAHAIERLFGILATHEGFHAKTIFFRQRFTNEKHKDPGWLKDSCSILFISHDLFRAGSEILLLNLIRWLNLHTSFKLFLLALKTNDNRGQLLDNFRKEAEVFLWEDYSTKMDEADAVSSILAQTGRIDLVYGNTVLSSAFYPFLPAFGAPVITHVHELEQSIQNFTTKSERENLLKFTSLFIACSAPVAENLNINHGISTDRIVHTDSFISPHRMSYQNRQIRRKLTGLQEETVIVWGCGTIYWRKGTDLFIETALKLKNRGINNFIFCWIGLNFWDNDVAEWGAWKKWEEFIVQHELSGQICFLGEKEDPVEYFLAGDIFYLPSREDPFPLVCLEAADCGLPVVCFEGAGGMPGFVEEDAGTVVPFLDVNKAADAIETLILDKAARETKGMAAKQKVAHRHSVDVAAPEILITCRRMMNIPPMVSIIVPVFNQQKFLKERIESILNQTFRDVEIIIFDDASTDQSYETALDYKWHPAIHFVKNEKNSGSPFGQWEQGIAMATGRYLWIAEGDDFSDEQFLETLLPAFNDPEVNLAYCASNALDEDGSVDDQHYLKERHYSNLPYPAERWLNDYKASGTDEIINALSVRNTIPNISAALFRLSALRKINIAECRQFDCAGDWYLYISLLKSGSIFYSARHLNYHRKHLSSVVSKYKEKAVSTIPDYFRIHKMVVQEFDIPDKVIALMTGSVTRGLRTIWPDLSDEQFAELYDEKRISRRSDE